MAVFSKFFGRAASDAAGFAAGIAVGPALAPVVQEVINRSWSEHPVRPPTIYTVVQGVAQGQIAEGPARAWAHEQGFGDDVFDALRAAADNGPAFGNLMDAYRRGLLDDGAFETGLTRLAIEPRWFPALKSLRRTLLSAAEAANARQQQFITADEQVRIAEEHGLTAADAEVQFELAGLPPGPVQMMEAINRGLTDRATFDQAIAEGHTKTKYTGLLYAMRRRLLSPHEYEEAALRGIVSPNEADAGAALSGMEKADARLLFEIMGRPLAVHQITTGLARGGQFGGTYADVPEPYRDGIRRSSIRPEYARLAYANRYTLPSAFVLRSLVQSGDLTEAEGHDLLLGLGWPPELAATVSAKWAGGTASGEDAHVGKAQTQLWTTLHRSYIAGESTKTAARPVLASLGLNTAAQDQVLTLWDTERGLVRKQLTAAQIKKAYVKGIKNQATGATWTRDDALAALIALGYAPGEANEYLDL